MEIPKFETKSELFKYLKDNEADLVYSKKAEMKKADGFAFNIPLVKTSKTEKASSDGDGQIKRRLIINTTMVKDSHGDVHINGIWNKSVKENKRIRHIREHKNGFEHIIADKEDLKASVKKYSWRDLGVDADGETEALVFDSTIKQSRNPYMYGQYKDGHVDNHSVGMHYVSLRLAINSDEEGYKENKAIFDEFIDDILNKDEVIKDGWYWAIYEAKAIEGSAVPDGSNWITPTLETKEEQEEQEEETPFMKAFKDWVK